MRIIFLLSLIILLYTGCKKANVQEDIDLMKIVTSDQERRNNDFVNSMRAQLEYFGAPANEAEYFNSSGDLRQLRQELLRNEAPEGLFVFGDTLDLRYIRLKEAGDQVVIEHEWSDSEEELKEFYKHQLQEKDDSLTYYKYLYMILVKEHALHMFNARMIDR